jgi:hypothetical protein
VLEKPASKTKPWTVLHGKVVPAKTEQSSPHILSESGESWKHGDLIEVSMSQLDTMPKEWFLEFQIVDKLVDKMAYIMKYSVHDKFEAAMQELSDISQKWHGVSHQHAPLDGYAVHSHGVLADSHYGLPKLKKPEMMTTEQTEQVIVQHLGDVISYKAATKEAFDEVVQSIAQPVCLEDNIGPASPQWKKALKAEIAKMFDEPKQYPMKHCYKDAGGLWWNAHCQFWQKQKPFPLGYACEAKYGKGPFVHGYHAPMPHGWSTGTGIGYWHADKKKWLLWEPDPLPKSAESKVASTIFAEAEPK